MATKNPRVVSYVSPENHEQLKDFMRQRGLTESKAIDVILGEFFGTSSSVSPSTPSYIPQISVEAMERIAALEKQMAEVVGK